MGISYTTIDGDTVDGICHKHYGSTETSVRAVFAANRGLAKHGTVLPAGITITLPDIEPPQTQDGSYSLFD